MTEWRDARLQKALEHAPDADARPGERTRRDILARARAAVAPPSQPWWKVLWPDSGGARMPWNAVLATVVVATLVTVIWHDREVPDAKPESAQVDRSAPGGGHPRAPEALPSPAPLEPPASPAVQSAPAPVQPTPPARKTAPAQPKAAAEQAPFQAQAPAPAAVAPVPSAEPARERAGGELAKSAAQDNARAERADATTRPAAVPAPAAPAPAPPSATAQAPVRSPAFEAEGRAGAPQSAARASVGMQRAARPEGNATHLRISGMDRRVEVPLDRPSRLADQLSGVIAAASSTEPLDAPPTSRVELLREGEPLGTLELAGTQVRWTPAGGAPRTGRPDQTLLQAVREELERKLAR